MIYYLKHIQEFIKMTKINFNFLILFFLKISMIEYQSKINNFFIALNCFLSVKSFFLQLFFLLCQIFAFFIFLKNKKNSHKYYKTFHYILIHLINQHFKLSFFAILIISPFSQNLLYQIFLSINHYLFKLLQVKPILFSQY